MQGITHLSGFFETYWFIILVTFLLGLVRSEAQRRLENPRIVSEITFVYGAYLCYYLVRGLVKEQVATAYQNAYRVIDFERALGLFIEADLQTRAAAHDQIVTFMNWVYVWCHWPVLVGVLIWLFLNRGEQYLKYRNALLISGALALLVFAFFPVAPPRFLPEFGFVDTIEQRSYSQHVLLPSGLANKYAAVPSLHVGWNFLACLAVALHARNVTIRALAVVLPSMMFASVVLTGNHYIIDGIAGILLALVGLAIAPYFQGSTGSDVPIDRPPNIAEPT